jgi:hypothetical protein
VLESLLIGCGKPDDPTELAQMVKSSVSRLLDGIERRKTRVDSAHRARLAAIARRVADWFPDGTLDAWAESVEDRLKQ